MELGFDVPCQGELSALQPAYRQELMSLITASVRGTEQLAAYALPPSLQQDHVRRLFADVAAARVLASVRYVLAHVTARQAGFPQQQDAAMGCLCNFVVCMLRVPDTQFDAAAPAEFEHHMSGHALLSPGHEDPAYFLGWSQGLGRRVLAPMFDTAAAVLYGPNSSLWRVSASEDDVLHLARAWRLRAGQSPGHHVAHALLASIAASQEHFNGSRLLLADRRYARLAAVTLTDQVAVLFKPLPYRNPFSARVHCHSAGMAVSVLLDCTLDAALHLLGRLPALSWPASLPEVCSLALAAPPPAPRALPAQLTVDLNFVRARNLVVRSLQQAFQHAGGVDLAHFMSDGDPSRPCLLTFQYVSKALEFVFLHTCASSSGLLPLKHTVVVKVLAALPVALLRHINAVLDEEPIVSDHGSAHSLPWPECLKYKVANLAVRMLVNTGRTAASPGRYHLTLLPLLDFFEMLPADARTLLPKPHAEDACVDSIHRAAVEDVARCQLLCTAVLPWLEEHSACDHTPLALSAGLNTVPERIKAAFAVPSPQQLLYRLLLSPPSRQQHMLAGHALLWNMAYAARRALDPLASVLRLRRDPVVTRKRSREAGASHEADPGCAACFEPVRPATNWSACSEHPCCLQCVLTRTEGLLVDAFRYKCLFSERVLEACLIPGCDSTGCSLAAIRPWLAPDMDTLLHILLNRRAGAANRCGTCNAVLPEVVDSVAVLACAVCGHDTCLQCQLPAHPGVVCPVSYRRQFGVSPEDVLSMAKKQQCPSCDMAVCKYGGCNHMTCACGAHWCWLCAAVLDRRDPSSHFADTVGGTAAASCKQFDMTVDTEAQRMRLAVRARTDISEELKAHCLTFL